MKTDRSSLGFLPLLCRWQMRAFVLLSLTLPSRQHEAMAAARTARDVSEATQAEIAKLQSSDPRQQSDAIMKLRHLGMRGKASAAIPDLIQMLGSQVEFPKMVLYGSSLSTITTSCSEECTFGGEAAETLARIGQKSDELLPLLKNENWRIRANAARAIGGLKDHRAAEELLTLLLQPTEQWEVRGNAALALGLIGDESAALPLINALKDDHAPVRAAAAAALGRLTAPEGLEPLVLALQDPDARVRLKAAGGLGRLKGERAVVALMDTLQNDKDRVVREVAAAALGETGDPRAVSVLIAALNDEYANVQINAARALGELRSREALQPLLHLLQDANHAVRSAAASALGNIGDQRARAGLTAMVWAEDRWQLTLQRGLEALAKLGHSGAKAALKECRRRGPDWIDWWRQHKQELLKREDDLSPSGVGGD